MVRRLMDGRIAKEDPTGHETRSRVQFTTGAPGEGRRAIASCRAGGNRAINFEGRDS